ncbi:FHA domain protein [Aspergillus neoniger CBS 115656]|uniref:FHA domain protein n=1 Tax=Aspergillus neoniger (strain CBS 115656) TaxID=1448310 RepID=A0A318Y7G0_ASPNB|nr:FHA domain protein [Aspergillus neoniger CBS 115656]PYH29834.1 FHA domain protein [Aspergillus neoniger CBS 115656]
MPATQAIVTLRPLSVSDDLPYRSLEFTSTNNQVNIGRASKRESKNLIPARNNGLFESRVMSRNHAKLWVCFDKQLVYIRDGGSMHGTWINGKRIPTEEDSVIKHDDVVTFGSTVYRGSDTFPPLKVRCEFEWPDPLYAPCVPPSLSSADTMDSQRTALATNTFCVPDDDDSDAKEDSVPMVVASDSASEIDNSTPDSDSDDQSVMEVSSPLTSPLKRDDARNSHVGACSDTDQVGRHDGQQGSQLSPIDLEHGQHEQPLVTPRMTPPSVIDLIDEPSNAAHDFDDFIQEADSASAMSTSDDEDSSWGEDYHAGSDDDEDDEVDSQSSFRSNAEQSHEDEESVRSRSLHVLGIRDLIASEASYAVEETNARLPCGNDTSRPEFNDRHGEDMACDAETCEPELLAVRNSTSDLRSQSTGPSRIISTEAPPPPILLQPTLSSPYGKTVDRSLPSYQNNPPMMHMDWWNPRTTANTSYSLHIPPTPQVPYADGPFVNNESFLLGETDPACNRGNDSVIASMATPGIVSQEAASSDGQEIQETPMPQKQPDAIPTPLPQMQRSEIGLDSVPANKPLKRKAEEIDGSSGSSELDVATYHRDGVDSAVTSASQSSDQETCYPDAQPQMPTDQQEIPSQLADLDSANELPSVDDPINDAETTAPPTKRAKTSSTGRFASHAASAALGVAIGAFGTIAALASLPPDYFE